jgi:hypothetical protein
VPVNTAAESASQIILAEIAEKQNVTSSQLQNFCTTKKVSAKLSTSSAKIAKDVILYYTMHDV